MTINNTEILDRYKTEIRLDWTKYCRILRINWIRIQHLRKCLIIKVYIMVKMHTVNRIISKTLGGAITIWAIKSIQGINKER